MRGGRQKGGTQTTCSRNGPWDGIASLKIGVLVAPEQLLWVKVEEGTADKLVEDLHHIGEVFQGLLSGYLAKDQGGGEEDIANDVEDEGGAKEEKDFQAYLIFVIFLTPAPFPKFDTKNA